MTFKHKILFFITPVVFSFSILSPARAQETNDSASLIPHGPPLRSQSKIVFATAEQGFPWGYLLAESIPSKLEHESIRAEKNESSFAKASEGLLRSFSVAELRRNGLPNIQKSHLDTPLLAEGSLHLTLLECYELALRQSETIAIQKEVIKEAEGTFLQAFSGVLPDIGYEITEERADPATAASDRRVRERKFTFTQPLFTGFKEFAAIAAGGAQKRQRRHELRRARELLFVDVADAFYFYLSFQDDIETLTTIQDALAERVKELKERQELGRSRASEVASAQARLSRVEADLEEVKGQRDIFGQLLEFLTGHHPITGVTDDVRELEELLLIENYLAGAGRRADVEAAYEAWQIAQKEITIARAGFFPEVSAEGNYYDEREGASAASDWDVTFTVDVPVFEGGENAGLVKEAQAAAAQEKLRYQELKRRAELQIKNAYTNAQVTRRRENALSRAHDAAQENYALQKDDYLKNQVNNLEVLQALEDVQEMRRAWTSAENETRRLYYNLLVTSGGLHDTLRLGD